MRHWQDEIIDFLSVHILTVVCTLPCNLPSELLELRHRPSFLKDMSCIRRKPVFCICENKDADQLHSNPEAYQRLCFRYIDSTIPLLSKYKISSL